MNMRHTIKMGAPALILAALLPAAAGAAPTMQQYAATCAADLAPLPAFNCATGDLLPVPATGQGATCPQLGGTGCTAGSRLLRLPQSNPNVTAIAICRKYSASSGNRFHDIAVVQHDRVGVFHSRADRSGAWHP